MRTALIGAAVLALCMSSPVLAEESAADAQLHALADGWFAQDSAAQALVEQPDGSFDWAGKLPDVTPAAQISRARLAGETLAKLDRLDTTKLGASARIDAAVLRTMLQEIVGDAKFREWEQPFDSDSNFWSYLAAAQPFQTAQDYRNYIARMRDLPRYFGEQQENARAGLKRGFSVPAATLVGRDESIRSYIVEKPEASTFYWPFLTMPTSIPAEEAEGLRKDALDAIATSVVPAYDRLLAFFRLEYVPKARKTVAAEAVPDGKAYYAQQIRQYTTLDLGAEEIHQRGLSEVARITAEMEKAKADAGFEGKLSEFITFLRTDPQFVAKTPDELMGVSSYVAKRVDDRIARYFGLLPRKRFGIRPVDPAIAPFYTAGRGGLDACQMNTYDLPSRPLYNIPALTLHECMPGHSFQAALALEREAAPRFRRQVYFSGYGEGWGLYTEYLGEEMGIYRTPYEKFGRLSYEMWRAARLVIDTGIHHKGWSRQQAIDYLAGHTALSKREVETEVDRYISWPGQALAYKLGEMTIRRLRAEAEAKLGPKFDIRKFHDVVLALGSVPLSALEARIGDFIADGGQGLPGVDYD